MIVGGGAPVSLLESFKSFLLWIGGTLAGITALLYTSGYLVTRSHLAMLGLYGLIELAYPSWRCRFPERLRRHEERESGRRFSLQ